MMFSKIVEQYQSIHIVDQCNFKMHLNLLRTLFKYTENSTKRLSFTYFDRRNKYKYMFCNAGGLINSFPYKILNFLLNVRVTSQFVIFNGYKAGIKSHRKTSS